jgi:hypothetical protein
MTPKPDAAIIEKYTWDHPLATVRGKIHNFSDVRVGVMFLVLSLIILYTVFS